MVEMKPIMSELLTAFSFERKLASKPFIDTKTKWDVAQQPEVTEILTALPRKKIVLVVLIVLEKLRWLVYLQVA